MREPDEKHFLSIPWCAELLRDPDWIVTPTYSRQPKQNTEDSLTAETLQSERTIRACISIHNRPLPSTEWISEVRSLMSLGDGMNGGPHMLHGGIIAALMDDCIGTLLTVNKHHNLPLSSSTVTAYLNVKYLKPIRTPQTIVVVAKSRERKGRKYWMDAEIRDGDGIVMAKVDSLWIRINREGEKEKL